ncbi:flagellar basal-body rod protein FlgF [Cribrihabitans marinus]|uniref:Flagellar basal-body rod protein FlgF n=1 Tax=Cribrihabitans marinus TaxID=1227549 RepID=A0A1H7DI06_9RHOB|nr:flagellar hook-basal body complex protein [Cribrihabitans marinus]GGH39502.1 flagellar basal-body rod protein FlgF [Cribrihabitans marinus]SEK01429.1 flagellar basal-body rod protein FlgF [Cribrihabitans marinus]
MESAGYATLSRQSGLMSELRVVANNIANAATTGYRQQGLVFSEFVVDLPRQSSLSMARAQVRDTAFMQGVLSQTGGQFDFAIEGDGFFMVETPSGNRLTRAGSFSPDAAGDLVTAQGHRVLDAGGAPLFVPPDARSFDVGADGTISADGRLLGQLGVYSPADPGTLIREGGVLFRAEGEVEPAIEARVLQGFLEGSNVNAIEQMARLVEVQRAYELGQSFLDAEDKRIREAVKALMR